MLSEIPHEELAAAVDVCASEVLWEAGVTQPPVDALDVAAAIGVVVARDYSMPYRGRFVRLAEREEGRGGQATIVVGQAERPEREQWAVAHEIGESVAHRVFDRLGVRFDEALPTARELVASRLANSILLPRHWFARDGRDVDWDLFALKERYDTASHELIARRMLDMRPPIVITVCDHGRVFWRRSNVTARPPSMLAEEKAVWMDSHKTGLPGEEFLDMATGLDRVRSWPVHEIGWKREILRSEVTEL
jgi:Zn-dependent peptidase ImmA (M78 family)